jgi:hypothetical protein
MGSGQVNEFRNGKKKNLQSTSNKSPDLDLPKEDVSVEKGRPLSCQH